MGDEMTERSGIVELEALPQMPFAGGACVGTGKLAAALAEVIGAMNRVPKNGRNAFHKYDYATESDIMDAVRAELSRVGVAIFPSVGNVKVGEADPKDRGGPVTTVELLVTFVHSSGEAMTTRWFGQGQDKTDKGYYKAYTGAMKYCLLKTFLMSTGDDPEATDGSGRPTHAPRQRVEQRQRSQRAEPARAEVIDVEVVEKREPTVWSDDKEWKRLNRAIRASLAPVGKADAEKYLEWVKARVNVSSLTHIPPTRLAKVLEHLGSLGDNDAIVAHVREVVPREEVEG